MHLLRLTTRIPSPGLRRPTLLALLLLSVACGKEPRSGGAHAAGAPAVPDTAHDAGAVAARAIVQSRTIAEAVDVTRAVLQRGGIVVTGPDGQPVAPASGAMSPVRVLPPEAVQLAAEARRRATRSHLTLEQFGRLLGDMGWPWREDAARGEQMRRLVRAWVQEAQRRPDDPDSFTPLFLAGMARQQQPAIDLAADDWSPGDLRLTYLETELILAALAGRQGGTAPASAGVWRGETPVFRTAYAAAAANPCDAAQEWFGKNIGTGLVGTGFQWGVGQSLNQALQKAGLSDIQAGKVGAALDAVGAALKIVKMAQIYGEGEVALEVVSDKPAHRPPPGGSGRVVIVATAGVNEEDYKQYEEALRQSQLSPVVRSCLQTLGLPSWTELGDIAKEAESWIVRWDITRGAPDHLLFMQRENDWYLGGQFGMRLERKSASSADAKLTLELVEERVPNHPAPDLFDQAVVTAAVDVSEPPSPLMLVEVAIGGVVGLVKALVDVGVGWIQTIAPIKESVVVPIYYHDRGVPLHIATETDAEMSMRGILGFSKGRIRTRAIFDGAIAMGQDSVWRGQMTLGSDGRYRIPDQAALARAGQSALKKAESKDLVSVFAGATEMIATMANMPGCNGTFSGAQTFSVEGWPETTEEGEERLQLTLRPTAAPDYFQTTSGCAWTLSESNGVKVVPNDYVPGISDDVALTIPMPARGQRQVIRTGVNLKGLESSTTITVGGDPE
ncbi:MAG TPA: hypothetical protein VFS05_02530 [Gemmatimonadaceae bacterium]|nr:hypothetical protein [Gemmatimonadaceae bacterium]